MQLRGLQELFLCVQTSAGSIGPDATHWQASLQLLLSPEASLILMKTCVHEVFFQELRILRPCRRWTQRASLFPDPIPVAPRYVLGQPYLCEMSLDLKMHSSFILVLHVVGEGNRIKTAPLKSKPIKIRHPVGVE